MNQKSREKEKKSMSKSKYSLQISKKIIKQKKDSPNSLSNKPPLKQNQTQIQFWPKDPKIEN